MAARLGPAKAQRARPGTPAPAIEHREIHEAGLRALEAHFPVRTSSRASVLSATAGAPFLTSSSQRWMNDRAGSRMRWSRVVYAKPEVREGPRRQGTGSRSSSHLQESPDKRAIHSSFLALLSQHEVVEQGSPCMSIEKTLASPPAGRSWRGMLPDQDVPRCSCHVAWRPVFASRSAGLWAGCRQGGRSGIRPLPCSGETGFFHQIGRAGGRPARQLAM